MFYLYCVFIKQKELQEVGIKPDYGVYFTKGLYQGDAAELRCLVVDSKALTKMEGEKNGRAIRSKKCIFFVCLAMTYLTWTCKKLQYSIHIQSSLRRILNVVV